MPRDEQRLSARQAALVEALLVSVSMRAACRRADVPERTARSWMKLPHFTAALRDARRQAIELSFGPLSKATSLAVRQLVRDLTGSALPADRIRAAKVILAHAATGLGLFDVQARLDELERQAREALEQRDQGGQR